MLVAALPSFLAKPKVQSRKFHFRCLRLRRRWWVLVFAVQFFCPWWQHRHRSNNSSWVPHPSSSKPEGVRKARQLRSGWITGSLAISAQEKTSTPSLSLGKLRLRFFPGTRTYCPGRRRRKGSSCSVHPDLFRNCAATGELILGVSWATVWAVSDWSEVSIDFEQKSNHQSYPWQGI